MIKMDKKKQYKIVALIAFAVIALTATLISLQGADLQGRLSLKPAAVTTTPTSAKIPPDLKPVSGEPGPYSGEPIPSSDVITRGELAKLIVATMNADVSSYGGCAPDLTGKWYEKYVCYLVSSKVMSISSDGKFHGELLLNRAEGAKIFTMAFFKPTDWYAGNQVVFKDVPTSQWFYVYVMTLAQKNVLDVEPLLPNQLNPLGTVVKNGIFSPANYLTKKAATIWAQNISMNVLP
jgi:hypothetical protein